MMKKNTVAWVIGGIVLVAAVVYGVMNQGWFSLGGDKTLLSYVPSDADQLLYLTIDEELIAVAERMQTMQATDQELDDILNVLEQVVVYQTSTETASTNLLFLKAKQQVSLDQIRSLGVVAPADGYEYERLGSQMRVYGDADALATYRSYNGTYAANDENVKQFLNAFRGGDYNLWFFSTPVTSPSQGALVGSFAEQLAYTYALSHLRLEQPFGRVVLQLQDNVIAASNDTFTPQLTQYAGDGSILYLETKDLTSLVGITNEQIKLFLPVVLGQGNPEAMNSLTSQDLDALAAALRDHIAISVTPQPGLIGVGLQLVLNTPEVYPTLVWLAPLRKSFIAPMSGGTGNIVELKTDDSITYALWGDLGTGSGTGLFEELPPMPMLTIGKTDDVSYITIFQTELLRSQQAPALETTDRSKLVFRFDNQALLQAMQGSSFLQMGQQPAADALFSTGIVAGTLDAIPENNQLVISFNVE